MEVKAIARSRAREKGRRREKGQRGIDTHYQARHGYFIFYVCIERGKRIRIITCMMLLISDKLLAGEVPCLVVLDCSGSSID